jgi:hypothetical protein
MKSKAVTKRRTAENACILGRIDLAVIARCGPVLIVHEALQDAAMGRSPEQAIAGFSSAFNARAAPIPVFATPFPPTLPLGNVP